MTQTSLVPFNLHQQLVEVILHSKKSFVVMGKLLYELKNKSLFKKAVGDGIETWEDYIQQPEIGLSRGEADRLLQIYEQFVLRYGFDEDFVSGVPIKNLHYLLPLAKGDKDANMEELLSAAKELSQRDFRERVGEIKYETRTYEYLVMKRCVETGSLSKVHDIDSEIIKQTFGLEKDQTS